MSSLMDHRPRTYTYPFISPTFQSHQLWTPFYLGRITINDPNYHSYLTHSITTKPFHLNALSKRVQKYGDNGFFQHKDIPVEQSYIRTSLKRSEVRPWDQIVSRPILTPQVIAKESELPFPSEHPYTSHISQFALFPSTKRPHNELHLREPTPLTIGRETAVPCSYEFQNKPEFKDVGTQTEEEEDDETDEFLVQKYNNIPKSFYVHEKAFSKGLRLETPATDLVPGTDVPCNEESFLATSLRPGIYRWDVSRAKPVVHQHSMTYPAPTTMYSPENHGLCFKPSPISQSTQQALDDVNHRVSLGTTYGREYSPAFTQFPLVLSSRPNSSRLDLSRGKYARAPIFHQLSLPQSDQNQSRKVFFMPPEMEATGRVVDKATQTIDFENEEINEEMMKLTNFYFPPGPESEDGGSYLRPSTANSQTSTQLKEPYSQYRSLLQIPYNRSQAIQRFHTMYPDTVPDLRVNSTQTSRRHIINGYHAYYWH